MIPYLNMNARITIGSIVFPSINSFRIEENIAELGNTATIVLARNYKELKGKPVLDYIKAGDAVTIAAGYNGKFFEEFTGFVRNIEAEMPLVIHCDDHWYPLKQNTWTKTYSSVTLKQLVQDIAPGYTIDVPQVSMGKMELASVSTYNVLRKIQSDYGLYARINGNTITIGFSWDWQPGITTQHIYHEQKNVRPDSNLTWKRKEDFNLKIRVEYPGDDRKRKYVEVGVNGQDNYNVKQVKYSGTNESEAKSLGQSVLNKFAYDGYEGTIKGFGTPRTHAGDSIDLRNDINPERAGIYLTDKVTIDYSEAGYIRENHLAYLIN